MNSLSRMIYFAAMLDNVSCLIGFAIAGSIFTWVVGAVVHMIQDSEYGGEPLQRAKAREYMMRGLYVLIISSLLSAFLPSGKVLYAIAASEYGEQHNAGETLTKAQAALNAWLDKQSGKPEK